MPKIQLRHDTSTNWTTYNPTLLEGEAGYETDTGKIKFGNGTTAWNSLEYFNKGTSDEVLHSLKGYIDNGELLTDSEGLADTTTLAHSSFDKSKFTVTGTPVITDDGIITNVTASNQVQKVLSLSGNELVFKGEYTWNGTNPSSTTGIFNLGDNSNFIQLYQASNGQLELFTRVSGTSHYDFGRVTITANIPFKYTLTLTSSGLNLTAYQNNTEVVNRDLSSNTPTIASITKFSLSSFSDITQGTIDLKQLSITVDGVEVFNGNKTGIDTIKPDDYTVVGTPTISADGIASGFSSSNYLTKTLANAITNNDNIKIYGRFYNSTHTGSNRMLVGIDGWNACIGQALSNSMYFNIGGVGGNISIPNTDNYWVEYILEYTANTNMVFKAKKVGEDNYQTSNTIDMTGISFSYRPFVFGAINNSGAYPFNSLIDLNSNKIEVNGNLVYQSCLKIPYTQSKNGEKIVNSAYRNRVADMAEQFGFTPYRTLSSTDYTLPQQTIYQTNQRFLIDSYRNGISYWELYSDRTLEQGGTCTSGVEYNLLKPFADTNYVLSVPYSAKTASTFTPSVTGDFIAKGEGLL